MFQNYLEQAKQIRLNTEKKWAALKGWRMEEATNQATPPNSDPANQPASPDSAEKSVADQIKTLELTIQKEREARKALEADAKKAVQYRTALGELDPDRLTQINNALTLQDKHEETLARAKSEAISERDKFHQERISQLEAESQKNKESYNDLKKRLAIQRHFTEAKTKGLPSELDAFIGLCGNQFEYDPATDKITKVLDGAGKEIFVDGQSATPSHLLMELRQGKQGRAIAACFEPYNQSNGGGLPITGPNGQPVGDWKNLSKADIGSLAFNK